MEQNRTPAPGAAAPGSGPGGPGSGQSWAPGPGQGEPGRPRHGHRRRYRYRSLFWPLILIAAGVVWLAYSLDVISTSNLIVLALVWPVFVIGIGVDLLVGHRSPAAGAIVGIVTIAVVVVLMAVGPGLGWAGSAELTTETFSCPVAGATQAEVEIGLSSYDSSIHALPASTASDRPLLYATVTHRGPIDFDASGSNGTATVTLMAGNGWEWWLHLGGDTTPWDIGLDPGVPLALVVRTSSGSDAIDLTGLQLRSLEVHAGSGDNQIMLPAGDPLSAYRTSVELHSSSGRMDLSAPDGVGFAMSVGMSSGDSRVTLGRDCAGDISFRGSSGQFVLTVRTGQALRVEVKKISSGDVRLPGSLTRVSGEGKEGVWQTSGYDSAANRVNLVIESMSSGSVRVDMEG